MPARRCGRAALRAAALCAAAAHHATAYNEDYDKAYFAMGCFWRAWDHFRAHHGVAEVRMGYMGGEEPYPSQKLIHSGQTKHAEVVEVSFDSSKTSYESLYHTWIRHHDLGLQGQQKHDKGPQFQSHVYPIGPSQRRVLDLNFWSSSGHGNSANIVNGALAAWKDRIGYKGKARLPPQEHTKDLVAPRRTFYPAVAPVWHCKGDPPSPEVTALAEEGGREEEQALRAVLGAAGGQAGGTVFLTFAGKKDLPYLLNWAGHLEIQLGVQSLAVVCTDGDILAFLAKRKMRCAAHHENFQQASHRWAYVRRLLDLDLKIAISEPSTVFVQNPMQMFSAITSAKPGRARFAAAVISSSFEPASLAEEWKSIGAPRSDVSFWLPVTPVRRFVRAVAEQGPGALAALSAKPGGSGDWGSVGATMSSLLAAALKGTFDFSPATDPPRDGTSFRRVYTKVEGGKKGESAHLQIGVLPLKKSGMNCGVGESPVTGLDKTLFTCSYSPASQLRKSTGAPQLWALQDSCHTRKGTEYCQKWDDESQLPKPRDRKPFGDWLRPFIRPPPPKK